MRFLARSGRWRRIGWTGAVACGVATLSISVSTAAQDRPARDKAFNIVPLGVEGGVNEGETTAWFISSRNRSAGLTCDAGTLVPGIRAAIAKGAFPADSKVSSILHDRIKAYLITHPHLDHVAGLVMSSPEDSAKPIYALHDVNTVLATDYFNWRVWPNMADRGTSPLLRRYHYQDLEPGGPPTSVEDTGMTVTAYPLSHGGTLSSAFLIRSGEDALLCMGDTGPDAIEKSSRLDALWRAVAPLVSAGQLRGIIVEASYPNDRKDTELFGHLTPRWLEKELSMLAHYVGDDHQMNKLNIIIGHIKPEIDKNKVDIISDQIKSIKNRGSFIIGIQGNHIGI